MRKRSCMAVAAMAVCSMMPVQPARAAGPWHVSTNGVDSAERDGLSWAQAWRTLSNAVAKATTGTIYVSNGVYGLTEQIVVSKALTLEGVNGRDHTIIDGNGVTRCFRLAADNIVLRGLTITNGYATDSGGLYSYHGGGIRIVGNKTVTLDNCLIAGNESVASTSGKGGGIFVGYDQNFLGGGSGTLITNCIVRGNRAAQTGGGVGTWDASGTTYPDVTVVDCVIEGNEITGTLDNRKGGGLDFQGRHLTVRNTRFAGNTMLADGGTTQGGGVAINNYPKNRVLLENCVIAENVIRNTGFSYGGGLFLYGSNTVVRNCLIVDNIVHNRTTSAALGGGVWVNGYMTDSNRIESCTIAGNMATNSLGIRVGSGVRANYDRQDLFLNCVVYGNAGGRDWDFYGFDMRTNHVHYTCTPRPMGGVGNITEPPLFVDAAAGDYRLRGGSPGVDQGQNRSDWMPGARDLAGQPRIDRVTGRVDMGCYEYAYAGSLLMLY